jgi:hypothetical protein
VKSIIGLGMVSVVIGLAVFGKTAVDANPPVYGAPPIVPYYGAMYGQEPGISKSDSKRIIELLESIDQKLPSGVVPQSQTGLDPLKVAQAKCAKCHTPSVSDTKGGGYILFADDKATAFKPVNRDRRTEENNIVTKATVATGTMPKGGTLTPAEKAVFQRSIFK